MKTRHVLLFIAAIGAARLALSERQHRQRLAVEAEPMHQQWIKELVENPETLARWTPGDTSPEEYGPLLHANSIISQVSVRFHAGLIDRASLREQARCLMERDIVRAYWKRFGGFREAEAVDRKDEVLNTIFSDEYAAVADEVLAA